MINLEQPRLLQYDFCMKDSQRLADLVGIRMDLTTTIRYCDLHIEIDPTEPGILIDEVQRREHTRQALCRAAFVMYGRAWGWGSGVRSGLGPECRASLAENMKQLHETIKVLRDKWVAHAVNHFDDVRINVDVRVSDDGSISVGGVCVSSYHVGGFTQAWMMEFRMLAILVLSLVEADISSETERLAAKARSMPISAITGRTRVDQVPLGGGALQPKKRRTRFSS